MTSDYETRLSQQEDQYQTGADIHGLLPSIHYYWMARYASPRIRHVFGSADITEFYANALAKLLHSGSQCRFVSIGPGDCAIEIAIAKRLMEDRLSHFTITGLEVGANMVAVAEANIAREGLSGYVACERFDVNTGAIAGPVDAFLAHHSLHHIVALERLFGMMAEALTADGHFLTCDMIGRNGHMRWPETLHYVETMWAMLPPEKKYNHQLRCHHHDFVNWDCSTEGFEGIRSQDILPLLIEYFSFEAFVGCGGFIDIFVERGFGPNYDPEKEADRAIIDLLASANDAMLETGEIKPTMVFADMVKKRQDVHTRIIGRQKPEFCVRPVS